MMGKLGATIEADNIDTQVLKETATPPIHILHDMVHCVKSVRNTWGSRRIIKNSKGEVIDWKYIVLLHELQSREQL